MGSAAGLEVKSLIEISVSHIGVPGFSAWLQLPLLLSTNLNAERQWWWPKKLGSCHPHGTPRPSSGLAASAWSGCSSPTLLGSEPVIGALSLSLK